jgi:plasmid stabilization system protein ParE
VAILRYTDDALDDVASIAAHLAKASVSIRVGERFADQIFGRCEYLAGLPGTMGRPRPELRPGLRSVAFKGHVIFFRYRGDILEVVNVLEGHRDIDSYYHDDDT